VNGLLLAIGFLTAVPVQTDAPHADTLGRAARWFPFVGFCLGGMVASAHWGLMQVFPPLVAAALTVTLWAALTGGLHLDGLADCCDGLLAATTRERRLEILRDPRLGAFGVAGLTLFLIAKVAAVSALPVAALLPFVAAATFARWLIVLAARQPLARPSGLAAEFAAGQTRTTLGLAALLPVALLGLGVFGSWRLLLAAALAHLIALGLIGLARARLGGVTGDVFGLIVELSELAALLAFVGQLPALPSFPG
jgi:adenosylcobinamide-GDP ribazoletransferase